MCELFSKMRCWPCPSSLNAFPSWIVDKFGNSISILALPTKVLTMIKLHLIGALIKAVPCLCFRQRYYSLSLMHALGPTTSFKLQAVVGQRPSVFKCGANREPRVIQRGLTPFFVPNFHFKCWLKLEDVLAKLMKGRLAVFSASTTASQRRHAYFQRSFSRIYHLHALSISYMMRPLPKFCNEYGWRTIKQPKNGIKESILTPASRAEKSPIKK